MEDSANDSGVEVFLNGADPDHQDRPYTDLNSRGTAKAVAVSFQPKKLRDKIMNQNKRTPGQTSRMSRFVHHMRAPSLTEALNSESMRRMRLKKVEERASKHFALGFTIYELL